MYLLCFWRLGRIVIRFAVEGIGETAQKDKYKRRFLDKDIGYLDMVSSRDSLYPRLFGQGSGHLLSGSRDVRTFG